jgi:predicted DNA-binding protein (MmcQ/YjbR family)
MNVEDLRNHCISKKGATEEFPFDNVTLVFKIGNKIFALLILDGDLSINLKCDPEKAIELREKYHYVLPGYHMNKQHWNTIMLHEIVNEKLVYEWIDDSYFLVISSLPKNRLKNLK